MDLHCIEGGESVTHEVVAAIDGFGILDEGDCLFGLRIATGIEFPVVFWSLDVGTLPDGVFHGARGEGGGDHIFEFYLIWF